MSSSDSETDSTIINNSDGTQNVVTDQWDFEGTFRRQNQSRKCFRGNYGAVFFFKPCANDSEEEGRSVREEENAGQMFITDQQVLIFHSINSL